MEASRDHLYDVIVIGAGVEGSATAYYLTSRYTKNVLLLEQFSAGHSRGSSHGGSRITRKAYNKPYYVRLVDDALKLWSEVESKTCQKIYRQTGVLVFGDSVINNYIRSLQLNSLPHRVLTGKEANDLYPDQLKIPEDYTCVTEPNGGILKANDCVRSFQSLFVENGGHLLDQHKVIDIVPDTIVTVVTNKGTFKSKKLVITAGAWTNKLLQPTGLQLPLKVIRTEVFYWPVENVGAYSPDSFPVFTCKFVSKHQFYGVPIEEYPGLFKVCHHSGPVVDPDCRDALPHSCTCEKVSEFIGKHFKGVSTKPSTMELCMYTVTANEDPFLDLHPRYPNIVIGAGFSGHGFKLAPVVGRILSELALDKPPSYDLSPFRINKIRSSL